MPVIPTGAFQDQSSRPAEFQAQAPGGVSFSPLAEALDAVQQRTERRAVLAARDRAIREQTAAGAAVLLQADEALSPIEQEAFNAQSRAINQKQITAAAQVRAAQLTNEYRADPDGFSAAYETYRDTTIGQFAEADPTHAAVVSGEVDAIGQTALLRLAVEKQNAEYAAKQAEYLGVVQSQAQALQHSLVTDPNEEAMFTGLSDLYTSLARSATPAGGSLLSGLEVLARQNTITAAVVDTFVTTKANRAVNAGDVGAIRGLITKLEAGAWFPDPREGQTKAQQLRGVLARMQQEAAGASDRMAESAITALRTSVAVIGAGGAADLAAVNDAVRSALPHATPAQAATLQQLLASASGLQTTREAVATMNVDGLERQLADLDSLADRQLRAVAAGEAPQWTGDTVSALRAMVTRELTQLTAARDNGNTALAVDEDAPIGSRAPGFYERRRQTLSQRTGVPVQTSTLFTPGELKQASGEFDRALAAGDTDKAVAVVRSIMEESGGTQGAFAAVSQMASLAAPVYVTSVAMALDPSGRMASSLVSMAAAGRGDAARSAAGLDAPVRIADEVGGEWPRILRALSYGDDRAAVAVTKMLTEAYIGAAVQEQLTGENPFPDLIDQLSASLVDLPNGMAVPAPLLGVRTADGPLVKDRVQQVIKQNRLPDTVVPIALTPEVIGFRDVTTGKLLYSADGSPLTLDPVAAVAAQKQEQTDQDLVSYSESARNRAFINNDQRASEMVGAALERTNKFPTGIMDAIRFAGQLTPPSALRPRMAQPFASESVSDLKRALKKHKGDVELALYDWALNDGTFDMVRQRGGANWRRYVPEATAAYVGRVLVRLEVISAGQE